MESFLDRLHTATKVSDTTEIIEYYHKHYQSITHLVPLDSLVCDLQNHVNIPRFVVNPKYYNILLPEFYKNLYYVIYNGPPNTLYETYTEPVNTEHEIARALLTCRSGLYKYIINPSLEVMVAYCHEYSFQLDEICNPPKELILRCIAKNSYLYRKYQSLFTTDSEAIKVNPKIMLYLECPSDELKMQAVTQDISSLEYIKDQTVDVCEYVAKTFYHNHEDYLKTVVKKDPWAGSSLLQGIAYVKLYTGVDYGHLAEIHSKEYPLRIGHFKVFTDIIVDFLIKIPKFIFSLTDIPEHYWTFDRLKMVFAHNPQILKKYPEINPELYQIAFDANPSMYSYIPSEYQTPQMTELVQKLYPFVINDHDHDQKRIEDHKTKRLWEKAIKGEVGYTQELCDRIFVLNHYQFQYIPAEYQTDAMLAHLKNWNYQLIPYIAKLTPDFCRDVVNKHPDAIEYIPEQYQTPEMCIRAVTNRGYNLKYCHFITDDLITLIFKTTSGPRKNRFDFLTKYSEADLLRILAVRPNLVRYLTLNQQTDNLIKTVLKLDGYVYQYIHNKTPEYAEIALANQPKAVKYM